MNKFIFINTLRSEFNSTCFSNIFKHSGFFSLNKEMKKKISNIKFKEILVDFLEKEKLSCPGSKLSFNNIQLLRKYGVVINCDYKDTKNKAYLELINDKKIYIRNQDQFTYIFITQLYELFQKQDKQNIINDLFYINNDYLFVHENKIMIENTEKTSDKNYRTDLSFMINNYKIIVEYLEEYHDRDSLLDNNTIDYVRGLLLLNDTNNLSYKITSINYFRQEDLMDKKTKSFSFNTRKFINFVDYMSKVIIDYYLISDKDSYCINKLTQLTGNKSLSKQLYTAHNNKNKPIVKLSILEKIFNWTNVEAKKIWYREFSERINQINTEKNKIKQLEKNNMLLFDSDSEDESDSEDDKEQIIYYEKIDNEIFLTDYGLHHYINMPPQYLANILEYDKNIRYFHSISAGLISSIEEIREIKEKLESNKIYGLKK